MEKEIIRKLNSQDLEILYPLLSKFILSTPQLKDRSEYFLGGDYTKDKVTYSLDYYRVLILGYFINDSLIGFIWGSNPYAGMGFVSWLWVESDYRRKGIARELLSNYEKHIQTQGGHFVELYCFEEMENFYNKNGYTKIGRRPSGYFKIPQLIMNKVFDKLI